MILFGPAGTGKTSIAGVLANTVGASFIRLNATSAKVSDVRKVGDSATKRNEQAVLFVDEIHRFSSVQQDVLLPYVEDGAIVLVGATTENPYHSVRTSLLSRCLVLELRPLGEKDLVKLIARCIRTYREDGRSITMTDDAVAHVLKSCCGDGRAVIGMVEVAADLTDGDEVGIEDVRRACPGVQLRLGQTERYDYASGMQGAIQASDPDAAIYWAMRWLEAGEDPRHVARRVLVSASEDAFGTPMCTCVAHAAYLAAEKIGRPECDILLAQAILLTASAPRDKRGISAACAAKKDIADGYVPAVPDEMRDCHYAGAARLGHGAYRDGADQPSYVGIDRTYYRRKP